MLHFIIPLKSKSVSDDFGKVCSLLARTLASVCNQTSNEYRVLVVCHEQPDGIPDYPRVTYIPAPFPPPPSSVLDLPRRDCLFLMRSDKGRKLIRGLEMARREVSDYVMFVDADDLVSRRIAQLCEEVGHPNGWWIDKGYRMDEAVPWIAYRRRRFNCECGSSHILRTGKAPFPERPDYSADLTDYCMRNYVMHVDVGEDMGRMGCPLAICPLYGAIYYCNDQGIFSNQYRRKYGMVGNIIRAVIKGRIVTGSFAREFGIGMVKETVSSAGTNSPSAEVGGKGERT